MTTATAKGIKRAKDSITDSAKEEALVFFRTYAEKHHYFTGGDVLSAWRETGAAAAMVNWRNTWGVICTQARCRGMVTKAGRTRPLSAQSHAVTLTLWESKLCAAPDSGLPVNTAKHYLDEIHTLVGAGKLALDKALWKAYELGTEDAADKQP